MIPSYLEVSYFIPDPITPPPHEDWPGHVCLANQRKYRIIYLAIYQWKAALGSQGRGLGPQMGTRVPPVCQSSTHPYWPITTTVKSEKSYSRTWKLKLTRTKVILYGKLYSLFIFLGAMIFFSGTCELSSAKLSHVRTVVSKIVSRLDWARSWWRMKIVHMSGNTLLHPKNIYFHEGAHFTY